VVCVAEFVGVFEEAVVTVEVREEDEEDTTGLFVMLKKADVNPFPPLVFPV